MTKVLACLLLMLPLAAASPEDSIRAVLSEQVASWNRGDVHAFMEGYEKSEATTFVGAKGVTKGHAAVLANYLKRYPTKAQMGTLQFSGLEIRMLGNEYASVIGRFHLDRVPGAGGESSGIFTLVFRKTPDGWKVIQDHTS